MLFPPPVFVRDDVSFSLKNCIIDEVNYTSRLGAVYLKYVGESFLRGGNGA